MFEAFGQPTPALTPLVAFVNTVRPGAAADPRKQSQFTPLPPHQATSLEGELFQNLGAWARRTPAADPLAAPTKAHRSDVTGDSQAQSADQSKVEQWAQERIALLARKYADNKAPLELLARLEVLNQRMLDAMPRVTEEKVRALEAANAAVSEIQAKRIERAKRLGLSV